MVIFHSFVGLPKGKSLFPASAWEDSLLMGISHSPPRNIHRLLFHTKCHIKPFKYPYIMSIGYLTQPWYRWPIKKPIEIDDFPSQKPPFMVEIFHGYVSHNQMIYIPCRSPNVCWLAQLALSLLISQFLFPVDTISIQNQFTIPLYKCNFKPLYFHYWWLHPIIPILFVDIH